MKVDYKTSIQKNKTVFFSIVNYQQITTQRKKILNAFNNTKNKSGNLQKLLILKHCKDIDDIHFTQSILALNKKCYDKAINHLSQCINNKKNDTISYLLLATTLLKLQRPYQSIQILKKAINQSPQHYKIYNMLGIALRTVNKNNEAEQAFIQAIKIKPLFASGFMNLSNLYIDNHDYNAAITTLKKLLFIANNADLIMKKIGICYLYSGDINTALFWYRQAHKKKPHIHNPAPQNMH